jgi:hypothetical protein
MYINQKTYRFQNTYHNHIVSNTVMGKMTATVTMRSLCHYDYTVAWVCALPLEMAAAKSMLDEIIVGSPSTSVPLVVGESKCPGKASCPVELLLNNHA